MISIRSPRRHAELRQLLDLTTLAAAGMLLLSPPPSLTRLAVLTSTYPPLLHSCLISVIFPKLLPPVPAAAWRALSPFPPSPRSPSLHLALRFRLFFLFALPLTVDVASVAASALLLLSLWMHGSKRYLLFTSSAALSTVLALFWSYTLLQYVLLNTYPATVPIYF
ncbi:unnamed protein product [Closterium sp. Naga37s-1]|nr:unnamed protein product [Closterium sp. Naga37s-1]